MWEVKLNGGGSVLRRWEGVFTDLSFVSEPRGREVRERKRGRMPPRAEDAAFLVIDTVDIVVCARPERVMSTWLLLPNSIE